MVVPKTFRKFAMVISGVVLVGSRVLFGIMVGLGIGGGVKLVG